MKFILFYEGPATPPDASHKGWVTWFTNLGSALVDRGSPLTNGAVIENDGSVNDSEVRFNGFSIIRARDKKEAQELIKSHPYLTLGSEYAIEVFACAGP